ncbi:MAG: glycosyltransferase family A protein [Pseudomonadota bacterium]
MKITIGIIARNEASCIADMISSLRLQDIMARDFEFDVVVVANGCTDNTAEVARAAFHAFDDTSVSCKVFETEIGGKSRSWNLLVHEYTDDTSDIYVFLDADVELCGTWALSQVVDGLIANPKARVCSGRALKDIAKKPHKNIVDRFSLKVSSDTANRNAIAGGLYAGWAKILKAIWLPEPTPGEDGFLNAMVQTTRFMEEPDFESVCQPERITHYFESHTVKGFFRHETRMLVGTAINTWLFEYFMAQPKGTDAGQLIRAYNSQTPGWVGKVVRERIDERGWFAIPLRIPSHRLSMTNAMPIRQRLRRYPIAVAATILNFVPYVHANRVLKGRNAASYW